MTVWKTFCRVSEIGDYFFVFSCIRLYLVINFINCSFWKKYRYYQLWFTRYQPKNKRRKFKTWTSSITFSFKWEILNCLKSNLDDFKKTKCQSLTLSYCKFVLISSAIVCSSGIGICGKPVFVLLVGVVFLLVSVNARLIIAIRTLNFFKKCFVNEYCRSDRWKTISYKNQSFMTILFLAFTSKYYDDIKFRIQISFLINILQQQHL